jgi:hypothetical protein
MFATPVVFYLTATLGIGVWAGEFTPLSQVAQAQLRHSPVLFGRAYRDQYFAYKLISTQMRRPEVLITGSSRVMQFRSELLNRAPGHFYNAGGAIQKTEEIDQFLHHLDEAHLPKILILGLDEPWFNTKTSEGFSARRGLAQIDEEGKAGFARAMNASSYIWKDLAANKIPLSALIAHIDPYTRCYAIGLNAMVNGRGFRNDGSYQYMNYLLAPPSIGIRLATGLEHLAKDLDHLASGDRVSDSSLSSVEEVLQFSKAHNIRVFAFTPPYAPTIVEKMNAGGRHTYLQVLAQRLTVLFKKYGYAYIDAFDLRSLGVTDDDMVDAYHGSEFVMLRIYRQLYDLEPGTLSQYSDSEFLDQRIAEKRSPFSLFDTN